MRTLLRISIPVEAGNAAYRDGRLAKAIEGLLEKLKPEAAYFAPDGGERTAFIVFDLKEPSQLVRIGEPLFAELDAAIEFSPIMNADDLKKGMAA